MSDDLGFVGSMGWIPGKPNAFDYTVDEGSVSPKLSALNQRPVKDMLGTIGIAALKEALPTSVDLTMWCSPIEDQKDLGSCTAHAGVGLLEYFEVRSFNRSSTPLGCSFTR
jgi:C1A family cysteine protease